MVIGVKIDFKNTYKLDSISEDLRTAFFRTQLQEDNSIVLLKISISNDPHDLLPNVYNLSFGPINDRKQIDDKAELPHTDYSKVFSTILLNAFNYLIRYPDAYIGIDGSNNARAYYYWRFLQRNYSYLNKYFEIFGIKYYVRITRYGKQQYDNPFDFTDIQTFPDRIVKTDDWPAEMYNYFIFRLKPLGESQGFFL